MWKSEDVHHHHQLHHHHLHPSTMSQMPILGGSESLSSTATSTSSTTPGHSLGRKKTSWSAFEKQGSAKLEKAEILQMTVDHLTMLHAKGFDAFSFDPHKFAMDYHSIGFRECASEVARYMVTVEGLDLQDPLRLRLMAHLQCYAAQREMSLKSSAHASAWNPSAFTTPTHQMSSHGSMPPPPPPPPPPSLEADHCTWTQLPNHHPHHSLNHSGHNHHNHNPATSNNNGESTSTTTMSNSSSTNQSYFTPYGSSGGSVKHYRPWGGELAY